MAYTLDMSKYTVKVAETPPTRAKREPEPNPLLEHIQKSHDTGEWLSLKAVPTAENVTVTNPATQQPSKVSEATIIERMLRRGARTLNYGIDIAIEPNAKKGHVDVFFHARARRARKVKGSE